QGDFNGMSIVVGKDAIYVAGNYADINHQLRPYFNVFPRTGSPAISAQPSNETVALYGSVTLTAAAFGQGALFYQWKFNGQNIPGATNANLTLTNAQTSASGRYSVVVSNTMGIVRSDDAFVTVLAPVIITGQPQPRSVPPGTNVTLSVVASGNP